MEDHHHSSKSHVDKHLNQNSDSDGVANKTVTDQDHPDSTQEFDADETAKSESQDSQVLDRVSIHTHDDFESSAKIPEMLKSKQSKSSKHPH